jgi:tRNA-dihydrouridine synthase C
MDGVTDHVYRDLVTARAAPGRIDFCVSEFIRVTDRPAPASVIRRSCPEVDRGGRTPAGVPVMVQLLGGQPAPLAETAQTAIRLGAFGIDLNFGCPAKTVNRHDGGATLLKTPERLERIVATVRAAVPKEHAVSAKIRLGWESCGEVVTLARAAENGGATFLTIHGRTKRDMYGPPADWEAIGRARAAVSLPVIANGDLNSPDAVERCGTVTGCTHFMLGRGPMGRPSLVCDPKADDPSSETKLLESLIAEYVDRLASARSSPYRQVARVKQWLSLGTRANPAIAPLFERVKRLETASDVLTELRRG